MTGISSASSFPAPGADDGSFAPKQDGAGLIQIFVNRKAGSFNQKTLAACLAHWTAEGREVRVSTALPFDIEDGPVEEINIIGGDGTIRHVLSVLHREKRAIPLRIFRGGTINLLHRELAGQQADDGDRPHYAATVNGHAMISCLSVGPDADIVATVSPRLKRRIGRLAYGVAALCLLLRWKRYQLRLHVDERRLECAALYVAKSRYYAGPWSFAPDARTSQPLLHGVALPSGRRREYLAFLLAMALGKVDRLAGVERFTCTELRIESVEDAPIAVQVDGDPAGCLPATVAIHPMAIPYRTFPPR